MDRRTTAARAALASFVMLAWSASAMAADVVEIRWTPAGRFEKTVGVPSKGFAEICGRLAMGQRIRWEFAADRALSFNIHYHVGKDVVYPERRDGSTRLAGELVAPVDQDYCWMWSNESGAESQATLVLQR